jgi:hypothetical protein
MLPPSGDVKKAQRQLKSDEKKMLKNVKPGHNRNTK